jgi:hypothetical protein
MLHPVVSWKLTDVSEVNFYDTTRRNISEDSNVLCVHIFVYNSKTCERIFMKFAIEGFYKNLVKIGQRQLTFHTKTSVRSCVRLEPNCLKFLSDRKMFVMKVERKLTCAQYTVLTTLTVFT